MTIIKGNAIVGQSGGPTSAINATLAGVIRGAIKAKKKGIIQNLYGMKNGIEGFLNENLVNLTDVVLNEKQLSELSYTPAAALGSCRKKLPSSLEDSIYSSIFSLFEKYNIRYFFYIGGNDSMDTVAKLKKANELFDYKVQFIGVPKTIDNDLMETDHTPGFGSAAKYIATTMEEIVRDCSVYTVQAVTIVEVMGRDSGWLTASAAIPCFINQAGPDYVYLPEKVFDMDKFIEDVKNALLKHPNVVVAVSEGVVNSNGEYIGSLGQSGATDVFGHKYLAGTGKVLENYVKEKIGCKVRSIELSLPQRCAGHMVSLTDINESNQIGEAALNRALNGGNGELMIFNRKSSNPYKIEIAYKDVSQIANQVKTVPSDYINESGNQITKSCFDYLIPLILGEPKISYIFGIPKHFYL